jgi:ligand-binding SRPBCC domain-containing protein
MAVFESRTPLPCSAERAFQFLTRPANMQAIAPPDLDMVFVTAPEVIELGSKLVFKVRGFGIVQEFEHEIVEFQPQQSFREKMLRGPLPRWTHDYILEPAENDLVVLINRIEFDPPSGLLGMIVTEQRVRDQLQDGHAHRSAALQKHLA